MCHWSFASNFFSYHTDCSQTEKFGWLEATHLLSPATQYIRDMESIYSKILDDIMDAQEPNGLCLTMAPKTRHMCGQLHDIITWCGIVAPFPEILHFYYDSTHIFEKLFRPCVNYMEYIKTRENGSIEHGLGDWGRDTAFGNNQANIKTAIYYRCSRYVEIMAKVLGNSIDQSRFRAWAHRITKVYNEKLLVTDKKLHPYSCCTSRNDLGSQDRNMFTQALALQFGLVPEKYITHVQSASLDRGVNVNNKISAEEIGLKYL
ncbi:glycoside hydrolase family 78 protein [Bipolaris oryzae ATCC 44560]|uniref:alpha-L-rhamnosidase n=1 Tax=Bipolaris oryzae ATCC 44560 TaxID=930090 RepID=W6YRK8_COCMI|nr:glycoside hydrolase family 78 protein [Bipolaris oryzae ATCC 44560]EUC40255.1 glycoside hydrolase family 78 protein [Bipolaris oryzae ATCC 44560]